MIGLARNSLLLLSLTVLVSGAAGTARAEVTADRKEVIRQSRALLAEARDTFARDQADSALALLDEVIARDDTNPDAYYLKGLIELSQADTAAAQESLVAGANVAPLSRRIRLLLARVKIAAGDVDAAEEIVDAVMILRPRDLDCLYIKGLIALARADTSAAVALWDETLARELGGGR